MNKYLIIRESRTTTPEAVDKALKCLELLFGFLQDERNSLEVSLKATKDLDKRGKLVDQDKAIVTEMNNLRDKKKALVERRRELVEEREEEISSYTFDPVLLDDGVDAHHPVEEPEG